MQAVRYLQLEPTIDTTIDVEVEELCTNTVASTPIMSPAIGLLNILLSLNTFPAAFPVAIKTC